MSNVTFLYLFKFVKFLCGYIFAIRGGQMSVNLEEEEEETFDQKEETLDQTLLLTIVKSQRLMPPIIRWEKLLSGTHIVDMMGL